MGPANSGSVGRSRSKAVDLISRVVVVLLVAAVVVSTGAPSPTARVAPELAASEMTPALSRQVIADPVSEREPSDGTGGAEDGGGSGAGAPNRREEPASPGGGSGSDPRDEGGESQGADGGKSGQPNDAGSGQEPQPGTAPGKPNPQPQPEQAPAAPAKPHETPPPAAAQTPTGQPQPGGGGAPEPTSGAAPPGSRPTQVPAAPAGELPRTAAPEGAQGIEPTAAPARPTATDTPAGPKSTDAPVAPERREPTAPNVPGVKEQPTVVPPAGPRPTDLPGGQVPTTAPATATPGVLPKAVCGGEGEGCDQQPVPVTPNPGSQPLAEDQQCINGEPSCEDGNPSPLEQLGAGAAGAVNALASIGNATLKHPWSALAVPAGSLLAGVSSAGVVAGGTASATGVLTGPGLLLAGASYAGLLTGGAMAAGGTADILYHSVTDERVEPITVEMARDKRTTSADKLAREYGVSRKEMNKAIHEAKSYGAWRGNGKNRNPDVEVDEDGEVYPKGSDESIGNIGDYLEKRPRR